MKLRKWSSNSNSMGQQFLTDGLSVENVAEGKAPSKVLGLLWDRSTDEIIMSTQNVLTFISTQPFTRRTVLHAFAGLFDPLGLLSPFHVRARLLFQRLWRLWRMFVRNRAFEIQQLTEGSSWRHCVSADNPANLLTRGVSATRLTQKSMWWNGPPWLPKSQEGWPESVSPPQTPQSVSSELVPVCPATVALKWPPPPLLDIENYSHLLRVLRVTAWIRRFRRNSSPNEPSIVRPLTASELHEAELYWLRLVQRTAFLSEIAACRARRPLPSHSPFLTSHPDLDDQCLLRVSSRLHQLDGPNEMKHPILMPSDHRFTDFLVEATHLRLFHGGIQATLVDLRSRFWILREPWTVRRVLNNCLPSTEDVCAMSQLLSLRYQETE